jgi:ribosome recycling factor
MREARCTLSRCKEGDMGTGAEVLKDAKERMGITVRKIAEELSHIRAGRASVGLVDHVMVEAYEDRMPLRNIANITTPDATTILIVPYDKSVIKSIEKTLSGQELGLNPVSDGNVVRISIPPLTEDRRKEILKVVSKVVEDGKVALRNIRRDANDALKKIEKAKEMGEDEIRHLSSDVDKLLDGKSAELDDYLWKKEKEILEG